MIPKLKFQVCSNNHSVLLEMITLVQIFSAQNFKLHTGKQNTFQFSSTGDQQSLYSGAVSCESFGSLGSIPYTHMFLLILIYIYTLTAFTLHHQRLAWSVYVVRESWRFKQPLPRISFASEEGLEAVPRRVVLQAGNLRRQRYVATVSAYCILKRRVG